MDESIILYSHLYFEYLQIKLMKEKKLLEYVSVQVSVHLNTNPNHSHIHV